jgi:transposase
MKLQISKSKNAVSYYVTKSIYDDGKSTSKVVEKLGTYDEVLKRSEGEDPEIWARAYVAELTRREKEKKREIIVRYSPNKRLPKDRQRIFNGGYLFLQQIYHELGLHRICREISSRNKFEFDLDAIISRLLYCRIMYPSSKLRTYALSKRFLEKPRFILQHIYRSLNVIAQESDYIQSELYKNSLKVSGRNTGVLYYDCTNYFFEAEQESGLRQYGYSKEHRPNPIVQMGLFMDGDGMPLSFSIQKGNTNEQTTLKPLEEKIISDFGLSRFIVCTDAGLSSKANRKFNNMGNRAFVTTQSVKQLKPFLKDWALDPTGWFISGTGEEYDISTLDDDGEGLHRNDVFYKERWIKEDGLEQRLIVTYSIKYRDYHRSIRNGQIDRARNEIACGSPRSKKSQNDFRRFIKKISVTTEGEIADGAIHHIDTALIEKEEAFDGFYAVCTNIEDDPAGIIRINKRRWQIEECFRILKSEFKARPVFLRIDERIHAHFATCFLALVIYRILEKRIGKGFSCTEITNGLRDMDFIEVKGEGYVPVYTRTDFTDRLHDAFGFRTDYEIISKAEMKKNIRRTKS